MAQLNNLFVNVAEAAAESKAMINEAHTKYLASMKKREKLLSVTLADAVSPLTGHKFSESFIETTSTGGYPQITLFPWLPGQIQYATAPGAAIRAFVDAFGVQKYQVLNSHCHEAIFDPASANVPEILTTTIDGLHWDLFSYVNGGFKQVFLNFNDQDPDRAAKARQHQNNLNAKHTNLDIMLNSLEWGRPLGIVLMREAYEAVWQTEVKDRLEMKVEDVIKAQAEDDARARLEVQLGIRTTNAPTSPVLRNAGPAVVAGIDLDALKETVEIAVFTPRSDKPTAIVVYDPSSPDFETKKEAVRNAAPGLRYEVVSK
jgi:hypothetical protein